MERSPGALLALLEAGDPAPLLDVGFGHREHLAAAWAALEDDDLDGATARIAGALRRITAALGEPQKYSDELTAAWMRAVAEGRRGAPEAEHFADFLARNPQLLDARTVAHG